MPMIAKAPIKGAAKKTAARKPKGKTMYTGPIGPDESAKKQYERAMNAEEGYFKGFLDGPLGRRDAGKDADFKEGYRAGKGLVGTGREGLERHKKMNHDLVEQRWLADKQRAKTRSAGKKAGK